MAPGFRPAPTPLSSGPGFFFTAVFTLEDHGGNTRYTARALHKDDADRKTHEDMGFNQGWSHCLDQLIGLVAQMK